MNRFRVTKYNPIYRNEPLYLNDEWTSISDVGKEFNNHIVTMDEYIQVETSYLSVIKDFCMKENIEKLRILGLEDHYYCCPYNNKQFVYLTDIIQISKDCLRERYWCRLETKNHYIHFGFDYKMYLGGELTIEELTDIANKYNLFAELCDFSGI